MTYVATFEVALIKGVVQKCCAEVFFRAEDYINASASVHVLSTAIRLSTSDGLYWNEGVYAFVVVGNILLQGCEF